MWRRVWKRKCEYCPLFHTHTQVSGLKGLPMAGDELAVLASEQRARDVSSARSQRADAFRASRMAGALHAQVLKG